MLLDKKKLPWYAFPMVYAILLEIIGLLLIYLEFFLPGGVMAIGGGLFLLLGLVLFIWQQPGLLLLIGFLFLLLALLIATCKLALWQIKRKKESLYLGADQAGFRASHYEESLIGKNALALTELKPSGHILIDGENYQAIAERGYISKSSEVTIVGGKGAYLIVRKK
jgi:membrane-bound ClpP family serine protease